MAFRSELVTWRELITGQMKNNGDSWDDVERVTLGRNHRHEYRYDSPEEYPKLSLDAKFDSGYGGAEGCYFTLWTKNYVYFPGVYDGAEWCDSVPRNPCDKATRHVGGQ